MPNSRSRPSVVEAGQESRRGQQPDLLPQQAERTKEKHSPWKLGGLSVWELSKRVGRSMNDDDVFGRSAQLAYYFFLAVFPALIFLTALFGFLAGPGTKLHDSLLGYIGTAMPGVAYELVRKTLSEASKTSGAGKLGLGLLATLWSATSGMTALEDTLNAVYNVRESRPLWKTYGLAIGLTVVCSILLIAALLFVLYGTTFANYAADHLGLGSVATWVWKVVQWTIALSFLAMVFSVTYYFCPDVDQRHWEWLTPGAVAGMSLWIVATVGFRVYLHFYNSYTASYGSLGAVMILLLWFYITGMMLLVGAEVNAEIENAAAKRGVPDAKHKGQKAPAEPERQSA